jgi:UPF0755 protein
MVRTPQEAINLAAIVEKETGVAAERRMVAGVYSNRLRIGMPLQADPTVIYPVTKGRPLGRRILRSELQADNGYNTYASAGLPAGPIANPGRASIAAVLNETASIFILVLAAWWLKEPLTRRGLAGVMLTLTGVCCMLWTR